MTTRDREKETLRRMFRLLESNINILIDGLNESISGKLCSEGYLRCAEFTVDYLKTALEGSRHLEEMDRSYEEMDRIYEQNKSEQIVPEA